MKKNGQPKIKISPNVQGSSYSHDHSYQFSQFILSTMGVSIDVIGDGGFHRFDDPSGKRNNQACWYVLEKGAITTGIVGNWRTGEKFRWRPTRPNSMTKQERLNAHAASQNARIAREHKKLLLNEAARKRAIELWNGSGIALPNHEYLQRKGIPHSCFRQRGNILLVPIIDRFGVLWSIQFIQPDGTKRFLKSGRTSGVYSLVGATTLPASGEIVICEGIATALTIERETSLPVAAAMSVGNLKATALEIKTARPKLDLIIAADNDHQINGNPGLSIATDIANLLSCKITYPVACGNSCQCTDFNDVENCSPKRSCL